MSGAEQQSHFPVEAKVPESGAGPDWLEKLEKYQRLGVAELVRFDPESDPPLRIWDLVEHELRERIITEQRAESRYLDGFWLAIEQAGLGLTLRLSHDEHGARLYPTPAEAAEQRIHVLEAELRRHRA